MTKTKVCNQCGQEKPIEDFSKSYKNLCKACVAENERAKRHNPTVYYGRGISVPIPDDATFVSPIRFQASVAAMQAILTKSYASAKEVAVSAVKYADALLDELKIERK